MTRHGTWLIAVVLAGGAALATPTGEIRVTTVVSDGRVLASFTVTTLVDEPGTAIATEGVDGLNFFIRRRCGSTRPCRACGLDRRSSTTT